jgi:NTP pyrophosphatase (non-canonical NTP hydrolase)
MGGECGEAQNVIKKLERERHGWAGSRDTVEHLGEELADVIHTAVLCAVTAGIDLEPYVVATFNAKSDEHGLRTRLSGRKYLPATWVDETSPTPHSDPAAFARRNPDGSWVLLPTDDDYDPRDLVAYRTTIQPGQEVEFLTIEDSGEATLTVHDDGTWSAAPPIPAEVNWIWIIGELETCNTSVNSLIRDSELEPGGCCDVLWYINSEVRLRFAPDGDRPRFLAVETPHG